LYGPGPSFMTPSTTSALISEFGRLSSNISRHEQINRIVEKKNANLKKLIISIDFKLFKK
jgi:hypothetical protein